MTRVHVSRYRPAFAELPAAAVLASGAALMLGGVRGLSGLVSIGLRFSRCGVPMTGTVTAADETAEPCPECFAMPIAPRGVAPGVRP